MMKTIICNLLFLLILHNICCYNIVRRDPFAILAQTLKSNQRAACDGDSLKLECPPGTKISIQLVLYGRSSPSSSVCPPTIMQPRIYTGNEGLSCSIREALRTVEELCQSKQSCSIITSTTSFGVSAYDPCPGVRKYVEVAYKCRPTTFSSRMVCGGESLSLGCSEPEDHIAIFSSSFKSAGAGPLYCPLRQEYIREALDYSKDEAGRDMKKCERADMTKSLIKHCHGKKTCSIAADPLVLGASACHLQHVLLKTTYACMTGDNFLPEYVKQFDKKSETFVVKKLVTSESDAFIRKEKTTENPLVMFHDRKEDDTVIEDTTSQSFIENPLDIFYNSKEDDFLRENTVSESSTDILDNKEVDKKEESNKNKNNYDIEYYSEQDTGDSLLNKISSSLILNYQTIKENGWKVMLVLTLSTGLGVSCFLLLIIVRLCRLYRSRFKTPPDSPSHVDLDTAMLDYEINTQLHTPLPEPRIMQISDTLPTKFSTLTRTRTKPVTKIAPLENYIGEPPKDTVIRYSTIGRNKATIKTSPGKNELDNDLADPRSFSSGYENNQLYY